MTLMVVLCVLAADPSVDQRLSGVKGQLDQFQFDKALAAIAELKTARALTRAQLVTLFELEGVTRATKGDANGAKDAFARLLTLDPSRAVPNELPPKVRTLFFSARTIAQRQPLTLTPEEASRVDGVVKLLSVKVEQSGLFASTGVRWSVSSDGAAPVVTDVVLTGDAIVSIPVQARAVKWTATLITANEWELVSAGHEEQALAPRIEVALPPPVVIAAPSADWGRPVGLVLMGGGVAAGVTGIVLGVQSAEARRRVTTATVENGVVTNLTEVEADRLKASALTNAIAGNVLMVGGGALAAAGVMVFFLGPRDVSIALAPAPGGLVAAGSF